MKRIIGYFFQGLLFFVPAALTIYILHYALKTIDDLIVRLIPGLDLPFFGAGLIITVALITLLGVLTSNILIARLVSLMDRLFNKVPLVKLLYSALKDLIGALVGDKKSFNKPVAVELTPGGPKVFGFVTNESLAAMGLADHVAVYVPQSYNFAGNLLVFPRERVSPLKADSSQVMAFLVSGGISGK